MTAADRTGVWLYAVTRSAQAPAVAGVAGERPRAVAAGGLAAVVGDVPLASFGEAALRRNLEDLDWLAAVARAHDAVVAALAARGPVAPIRLATVYQDDGSLGAAVRARSAGFARALDHVSGRIEWGVKAFLTAAPDPRPASPAPPSRGAGVAYLARRRSALASREDRQQRAADEVNRLHTDLSELAADATTHPPQSRALAGEDGPMVLNGAYLVDTGDGDRFARAVEAWRSDVLDVRLTGPWPPYSFSSPEEP